MTPEQEREAGRRRFVGQHHPRNAHKRNWKVIVKAHKNARDPETLRLRREMGFASTRYAGERT